MVRVKLFTRTSLHAKLYLIYDEGQKVAKQVGFLGSSNLTFSGLNSQGELNIDVVDQDAAGKLSKWFQDRWEDRFSIDITDELIAILEESWAGERLISPYHIYLKMAYHLSRDARAGVQEFELKDPIKKKLLQFQRQAVYHAAKHIQRRNGVMIGDVVGLGKTYTACALAHIFEEEFFYRTLIICPANLDRMWMDYRQKFNLRADILKISMVQNRLNDLKRYQLVITDSNRGGKDIISTYPVSFHLHTLHQ